MQIHVRGRSRKIVFSRTRFLLAVSHLLVALASFQVGVTVGSSSLDNGECINAGNNLEDISNMSPVVAQSDIPGAIVPSSLSRLASLVARVNRDEFIANHDFGIPWDETIPGNEEVLLFYSSKFTLPNSKPVSQEKSNTLTGGALSLLPVYAARDATRNCQDLRVVLVSPSQQYQCLAVVGQWNSHHVHKLLRRDVAPRNKNPNTTFSYVSRLDSPRTLPNWKLPKASSLMEGYGAALNRYLQKLPQTVQQLQPIAEKVAGKDKTVVVMVCNFGQSELLLNFVCSARARSLDMSKILLFATDRDVYELALSLDLAVFEVKDAFGFDLPTEAAGHYGDSTFAGMMMAKVYCVHLINLLGYNLLFQDVDVVWYRNPLQFFLHDKELAGYDICFQDDGSRVGRYAPYSANSGFYFVKHNDRTEYLLSRLSRMGDLVDATGSHQEVFTFLISEHASLLGLKVKVLGRDSPKGEQFPGGFHFHRRKAFMKEWIAGKHSPYIFHMSWTSNKDNKIKFFHQMQDWYVREDCIAAKVGVAKDIDPFTGQGIQQKCCLPESMFKCHYRDKPSKKECKGSPPLDKGRPSFW